MNTYPIVIIALTIICFALIAAKLHQENQNQKLLEDSSKK